MNRKVIKITFYEALFIIFLSAVISLSVNYIRSNKMQVEGEGKHLIKTYESSVREISIAKAKKLVNEKTAFMLDSRSSKEFLHGHISGAVNLPNEEFDEHINNFLSNTDFETTIITYCDGAECGLAKNLAEKLQLIGYRNVFYIKNGLSRWEENKLKDSGNNNVSPGFN